MPTEQESPLEFIATDDLIAEIKRRHKAFFLVARPNGENSYDWRSHQSGDIIDCLGMIDIVKSDMIELHKRNDPLRKRPDGEDEIL
ncbi:MAG TPA: hypothetical protein VK797_23275 [Tepidisphaeraceae bacterium]|jgi:hypothetical protein|nr:hypothetical protein [Tepidisphaeraceae bacterium]